MGKNQEIDRKFEEHTINKNSTQTSRMFEKIQKFEQSTNSICYSLCSMAQRQDERVEVAFDSVETDKFQKMLIRKVYNDESNQNSPSKVDESPMPNSKSRK